MKIIINEKSEKRLIQLIKEESLYTNKVLRVKKFLDDNLSRADYQQNDDNTGLPSRKQIAVWMSGNEAVKTFTDQQLLDVLQERFKDMFDNEEECYNSLKKIMIAWYKNKIDKNGVIENF